MAARRRREEPERSRRKPATTPEARENELISLAYDVAERQMRDGSASSQVITQFLKLGSSRERIEQERMKHEVELMKVRREAIESQRRQEELHLQALAAMRSYQGIEQPVEEEDDE